MAVKTEGLACKLLILLEQGWLGGVVTGVGRGARERPLQAVRIQSGEKRWQGGQFEPCRPRRHPRAWKWRGCAAWRYAAEIAAGIFKRGRSARGCGSAGPLQGGQPALRRGAV